MSTPLYLYIHGFNSSPQSYKARQLALWLNQRGMSERIEIPQLPYQPAAAIALLERRVKQMLSRQPSAPLVLLGSSLGGFYATYLVEQLTNAGPLTAPGQQPDVRAVLINPAVRPFDLLDEWLGDNENFYTHEKYRLNRDHLAQLQVLNCPLLSDPGRYLLLTQTGDEVLDYRQGVEKYAGSPQRIITGGDHGFQQFQSYWPCLFEFAGDKQLQRLAEEHLRDSVPEMSTGNAETANINSSDND
jgi:hypothetical protein